MFYLGMFVCDIPNKTYLILSMNNNLKIFGLDIINNSFQCPSYSNVLSSNNDLYNKLHETLTSSMNSSVYMKRMFPMVLGHKKKKVCLRHIW